jgi:hypothetical protein
MSSLVLPVLANTSECADSSNCQERKSGHFQPELVQHPPERGDRRPEALQHGGSSPAARGLLRRYSGNDPKFPQRRDLDHQSILPAAERTISVVDVTATCDVRLRPRSVMRGGLVDQQLKQLMKELGEAINESLSDSDQIAEVVSRIKEGGYDIFLVLEATIGVSKQGEHTNDKTSLVSTLSTNPELKISDQDLKFLKSLRIKLDEEEEE